MFAIKKPSNFLILFLLSLFLCSEASFAATNNKRFEFKKTVSPKAEAIADTVKTTSSYFFIGTDAMWNKLVSSQKTLRDKISIHITNLKNGQTASLGLFLLICFIYGLIHALGPGHGKTIVVSYFLARKGNFLHGVGLGTSITTIHTFSAVALLFILYGFAQAAIFPIFEASRIHVEKASYILIILTGILLIAIAIRETVHESKNKNFIAKSATWKELLWLAFVTGIVPCPAVALIVFFCLLNKMPGIAILGALAICCGMAVTNTVFSLGAILTRRGIDMGIRQTSRFEKFAGFINSGLSFFCGICITMLGIFLFLNAR